jgi:hypothetical protein
MRVRKYKTIVMVCGYNRQGWLQVYAFTFTFLVKVKVNMINLMINNDNVYYYTGSKIQYILPSSLSKVIFDSNISISNIAK